MLTYADVCSPAQYARPRLGKRRIPSQEILTYADVCWRMLSCAIRASPSWQETYPFSRGAFRERRTTIKGVSNFTQPVWLGSLLVRIEPHQSYQGTIKATGLPSHKNRALLQPSGQSGGTLPYFVAFVSANKQLKKNFIFVTFKDILCSKEE